MVTKLAPDQTASTPDAQRFDVLASPPQGSYVMMTIMGWNPQPRGLEALELEVLRDVGPTEIKPAQTLEGLVGQLVRGDQLDFPPYLRELARRAIARQGSRSESSDLWAARLARESAEHND